MYWARLKNEFQAADIHRLRGNTAAEPKTIAVAHRRLIHGPLDDLVAYIACVWSSAA